MSADNYCICPRCKRDAATAKREAKSRAAAAYGKVSQTEYAALLAMAAQEDTIDESLREDWDLGMEENGSLYVSYSCSCNTCGFAHEFKHEKTVDLDAKARP
jgi:hypothetical protein